MIMQKSTRRAVLPARRRRGEGAAVGAEAVGTGLLVAVVVGSGAMAQDLSDDVGVQLLANTFATVLGLTVLILVLGPASGAHFNPVVSLADWLAGRRRGPGLNGRGLAAYTIAQVAGAIAGAILANLMFDVPAGFAERDRTGWRLWLGEGVATAGLVFVIFALARTARATLIAPAVGAWIGAAYWFTSSTSFANPAVTIGRAFSDSFAGIAPGSVPAFVLAQVGGALVGLVAVRRLYPDVDQAAANVVVPPDLAEEPS